MVRIDHLSPEQYRHLPARERDLLIEQPETPCPIATSSEEEEEEAEGEEQDDLEDESEQDNDEWPTQEEFDSWLKATKQPANDTEESHCYVNTRKHRTKVPKKNFPAKILEAQTVIVTCGMNNFEFSSYSNSKSKKFRSHIGDRRVEIGHFGIYPEDERIFLESFKEVYPELCKDRNIYLCDCTKFDNPDHDKDLRSHLGFHPTTFTSIVDSDQFLIVNEPLCNLKADEKNLCINVCKSGRHRSVGNGTGQQEIVQDQLYGPVSASSTPATTVQLVHLQKDTHWDKMCNYTGRICALCDPANSQNKHNMRRAYGLLKSLIPTPSKPAKASATTSLPLLPPVMSVSGFASGSSGGAVNAKAITPPVTHVPAKAQPAALTRATQAALLPSTAIGAVPRRASNPPIPVIAAAAAEAAPAHGTARASSRSVPISGTTRNRQSSNSSQTITPKQLQDLHKDARIVVKKQAEEDSDARKDDRRREDRTEKERSRGTEATRREKAESLHAPVTREPTEAEIDEEKQSIENIKVLVDQFKEDVSVLVINQICKHYFHGETFFQLVQRHGEPEKILFHLCK